MILKLYSYNVLQAWKVQTNNKKKKDTVNLFVCVKLTLIINSIAYIFASA